MCTRNSIALYSSLFFSYIMVFIITCIIRHTDDVLLHVVMLFYIIDLFVLAGWLKPKNFLLTACCDMKFLF